MDALELPRRFALETAGQVVVYGVRFDTGHGSAQIVNAPSPVPHWGHLDDLTHLLGFLLGIWAGWNGLA
ncbi:hypothetical protein EV644_10629 [Kribbella orskensis]|uniref:Uncharacterized protein n=1 Tax=Kribbella orskensis TaxID=2512216 RepID=A0ABY2BJP9_9ACTN|nr:MULTISPECIES: hypothetical protein [Kribbella]TCN40102.1 hypothetical protein EV642_10529 [Kribbella sp. VKM Ac-2500]TCO22722.1 hypothetical protein EV644_10629 [Kribbella orskensis]